MEKHKSIYDLIERLKLSLNFNQLEVKDHWEADLCAIGFQKNKKLVYLSTYNYVDDDIIKFDYELELINESEIGYNIIEKGSGVLEDELIAKLYFFLEV